MEYSITETDTYKILKISGKIKWDDAHILEKEVKKIIEEEKIPRIVFNLDEVDFICSGGIGVLITNLEYVKKKGGDIYLISSNDYVKYLFDTLKFDLVFKGCIFDNYEEFYDNVVSR